MMNERNALGPRRGSQLFLLLATASIVLLFLSALLFRLSVLTKQTQRAAVRAQCRALAEGGLELARAPGFVLPDAGPRTWERETDTGTCRVSRALQSDGVCWDVVATGRQPLARGGWAVYEIQATLTGRQSGPLFLKVRSLRFFPNVERKQ